MLIFLGCRFLHKQVILPLKLTLPPKTGPHKRKGSFDRCCDSGQLIDRFQKLTILTEDGWLQEVTLICGSGTFGHAVMYVVKSEWLLRIIIIFTILAWFGNDLNIEKILRSPNPMVYLFNPFYWCTFCLQHWIDGLLRILRRRQHGCGRWGSSKGDLVWICGYLVVEDVNGLT